MLTNKLVYSINENYIKSFLAILITSYFYCLPITRFSFIAISTDLRLYDIVFIIGFIFIFLPMGGVVLKNKVAPKYIFYSKILIGIILYSMVISFVLSGSTRLAIACVRFFRFFSFLYAGYIIIGMVKKESTLIFLFKVFYINILIQAIISSLQVWGWIPPLWPDYWLANYGFGNVATLSPHHKHIGVIMIIGFALSLLFIINNSKELRTMRILAIVLLPFIILSMFGAHTRTGLFGGLVFILVFYIISANNFRTQAILIIFSILIYFILADTIIEYSYNYFNNYIVQKIANSQFGMFDERAPVYSSFLPAIIDKPWLIIFGVGYQNINYAIWGTGAHNNFAQVFFETGIIGMYAFCMLFYHATVVYRSEYRLKSSTVFNDNTRNIMFALIIAIISTMFSGETFWGQYSMFTLSGQIFVLICITSHPLTYNYYNKSEHQGFRY